ncbi:MAG: hypothetical protein AAF970_13745 [Bacteroidota bacterium]
MTDLALPLALALGAVSGFRHAFEPDHVVAVSTLLEGRPRLSRSLRLGASWGAGHTTTLVFGVLLVTALNVQINESVLGWLEVPVGAMLIGLGLWSVRDAWTGQLGQAPTIQRTGWGGYAVGLVHGMAGSGALLLLVAATLPTPAAGIGYAVLFGLGSVLGMTAVTLALWVPFRAARQRPQLLRLLTGLAGALSIGLGLLVLVEVL